MLFAIEDHDELYCDCCKTIENIKETCREFKESYSAGGIVYHYATGVISTEEDGVLYYTNLIDKLEVLKQLLDEVDENKIKNVKLSHIDKETYDILSSYINREEDE